MNPTMIEKQLVCSECGRPLRRERISAADVERTVPRADDDFEDDLLVVDAETPVETIVERGPVCARCAEYR